MAPTSTALAVVERGEPRTLTLTGRRTGDHTLQIRGAVSLGDHVTATVRLKEPA